MTKPNHELSPALIVLMSIATGLAVASNYYAQPLLDTIARNFSLSASSAALLLPPRSWAMPQVYCFLFPSVICLNAAA
ncbi:hypothetical protein A155_03327 [Escherichia coli KTE197]|nr:hypothetical protein A31A_03347 [Escherichia coli KTE156]ELH46650.1 hypothetical protein A155_03327 [Escherichia coli KTE197]EOW58731.1 hypothetical protein A319_03016 [Escherichia coli KTE155]KDT70803.1 permease domain protein [Escherichia coli 3-373-03_S3_C3]KDU10096.1 permease domain protein [Escherichia coli 3-373-03_S3_C2]MDT5420943.1 hypothetical protein [Escherichia coli]